MSDNPNETTPNGAARLDDSAAEDIMRKYDKESATRIWEGRPQKVVRWVLAFFSLYCIWSTLFSTSDLPVRLTAFLGLITVMGYLTYPAGKKHVRVNYMPWFDVVLMVVGAGSFFYYCFNYMNLVKIITSASKMTPAYILLGVVAILCLAELCRRCVGLPILFVVGGLLIYTFISMMHGGQSFMKVAARVVYTLFYGTSGVMSTPVQVCLKFIAVFIIFGAFLERTGISNFFIDLANSVWWALRPAARPRWPSSPPPCAAWCPAPPWATPSPPAPSPSP
jgi:TRAP-type uncharacterized transport system fused permease subunit